MATDSAVCSCKGPYPMGYYPDPEGTGMWVHYQCGKPSAVYLDHFYRQLEAEELGQSATADNNHTEGGPQ